MEINKFLLFSFSLSLVLCLGVIESFDYHEKEIQSEEGLQEMYDRWRSHHKVETKSPERFNVFKTNVQHVHETNKMNKTYKLKLNHFADLTLHEWKSKYADSKIGHKYQLMGPRKPNLKFTYENITEVPCRWDWRQHNAIVPIKNQGQCGSCWAFAAVCCVEAINAIRTGQLIALSEQQLIDCDSAGRNNGCDGGLMCESFKFIHDHGGLATEESYPYVMKREPCCTAKFGHHSVTVDGPEYVPRHDEWAMLRAVAHQPVTISIDCNNPDYMFYSEGIYTGPCGTSITHAMTIVGYDWNHDMKWWIVRNSWGEGWGDKGYMLMQRETNIPEGLCGMYIQPNFPKKDPNIPNCEL